MLSPRPLVPLTISMVVSFPDTIGQVRGSSLDSSVSEDVTIVATNGGDNGSSSVNKQAKE